MTLGDGAWWWFRSLGNTSRMAAGTMNGNILYHVGCEVNDDTYGIRPVLWNGKIS